MAKVLTFKSKEDIFAEEAMKSGLFDLDPFAFLTEADERELTMIGKAAYADKLKRRAAVKARREKKQVEEEKRGIKRWLLFRENYKIRETPIYSFTRNIGIGRAGELRGKGVKGYKGMSPLLPPASLFPFFPKN